MLKISVFIIKNKTTMKSISNLLFCSSYLKINRNKIESYGDYLFTVINLKMRLHE